MSDMRLRRPLFARLFGTTTAGLLTFFGGLSLILIVLVLVAPLFGKSTNGVAWALIGPAVFVLLWARVLTAWTRFDDEGVHTRFWVRFDYPWTDLRSVTLQRLGVLSRARTPGPPAIIVRTKKPSGREDKLAPVLRCGRHRRDFAEALLTAARAHGVTAVVGSDGWDEKQEKSVDYYEG